MKLNDLNYSRIKASWGVANWPHPKPHFMILSGHKILLKDRIEDLYSIHTTKLELPYYYNLPPDGTHRLFDYRSKIVKHTGYSRYEVTFVKPTELLHNAVTNIFTECDYTLEIIDRIDGDLLIARHEDKIKTLWVAFNHNVQL